jgi:glycosyltransferase involved in cell wall biosynthesis
MISVIVCTYNRAPVLRRMLASFYAQEDLDVPHELILVNNNATDETAAVAAEFADKAGFRYLVETEQGLSAARNCGIRAAQGDIIACLDDDVLVSAAWLRRLAACYRETNADVVGGRSALVIEAPPPPWFGPDFRRYLSEVDLGRKRCDAGDGRRLFGLNVSFRREVLERCGGFDPQLGRTGGQLFCGEERAVIARVHAEGGKIVYDPDAWVGHIIGPDRLRFEYFLRLCAGTAATYAREDAAAGPLERRKRLIATLLKYAVYAALLPPAWLLGRDRYPYRALRCRFERMRVLLRLRGKALWA